MDRLIVKTKRPRKFYVIAVALPLLLIVGASYVAGFDWSAKVVARDNIRVGAVARGDLVVDVVGSGRIMPFGVEWVVARMPGVISKIHVDAGDTVVEGQVLLELSNDETDVQLAQMEARLLEAKAMLAGKEFDLDAQQMQFRSAVVQAQYSYEADKVVYEAYSALMDSPNPPVSKLEFFRSKVAAERQQQLYLVADEQSKNFQKLKIAQMDEVRSRVRLAEHERNQYLKKVDDLKIVARKAGVIQDFDLRVGQSLAAGENIGKIADPANLFVRLELPAIEAHKIAKEQIAKIQINRQVIDGIVTRIDPNIKGTTIEVDVRLVGDATSAKVDMFVNARIIIAEIKDTLILPRPYSAVEDGISKLYRLDAGGTRAELVDVKTGTLSSNEMQIVGGLNVGDRIVLSELRGLRGVESIRLN
jgi:HlyD family secretion protein